MVIDDPYLPYILKDVVFRLNEVFETREVDPFSVTYDWGLYNQVGNDRLSDNSGGILTWLVMPFIEHSPKDESYFADVDCELFIAAQTESGYTQQQREDINFFPRLIPVYKQLIEEIKNEPRIDSTMKPTRTLLPYWGGGEVNSPSSPNLWKDFADCIKVGLKLKIENSRCYNFLSSI